MPRIVPHAPFQCNSKSLQCRKHMMCPVAVANEMSGLKGRVEVTSHPQWRLKVDAVISGPSFGAGDEDQGSDYASDERADPLDASGRDHRDHGSEHAAVAETVEHGRL